MLRMNARTHILFNLLSTFTNAAGCSPFNFCTVKTLQAMNNQTKIWRKDCGCKTRLILSASSEPFWIECGGEGSLMLHYPWGIFTTRMMKEEITEGSSGVEEPPVNLNMQECHQAILLLGFFNSSLPPPFFFLPFCCR